MTDESTESASFYSDFIPVKSRKKRKNRPAAKAPSVSALLSPLREQVRHAEWFAQCSQILESSWSAFSSSARTPAILCLGLGSPSASLNARIQLAFLTETCKRLKVAHEAITIYDPIFTTEDIALLEEELQMRVLPKNRSGERDDYILSVPTICFMPHCDIELYDTVLRANWSRDGLSNLFLLGNQLQEYLDNKPTTVLEAVAPCLLRVAPLLENQRLPISDAWPTAFNNISAQYFPSSQSSSIDKLVALWRPHPHEEEGGTGDAVGEGN